MIRFILILILLTLAAPVGAFENDKHMHAGASFVAAGFGVMYMDINHPEATPLQKWLGATAIGMLPGVLKEAYDSRPGGSGWDNEDVLADFIGATGGAAAVLTITWTW